MCTTIYTLERGRAPSGLPRCARVLQTASYDVFTPPVLPLHVGQTVRILTLATEQGERVLEDGSYRPATYRAALTGVEGTITAVRTMELAITEFIVKNEDPYSQIAYAYVTVQHIQGATVNLSYLQRALRTLLLPFLSHTRHAPLVEDAKILAPAT